MSNEHDAVTVTSQATAVGAAGAGAALDAVERSVAYFQDGLYCSEAILRAFNETYDLGLAESAYRLATPFGAGMGAAKCSCGAVTGGLLVLGLAHGRDTANDSEVPAFEAAKELHDRFRRQYKVICCRGLTRRLPWGEPEHHEKCQEYVRFAADNVRSLLHEPQPVDTPSVASAVDLDADPEGASCRACPELG